MRCRFAGREFDQETGTYYILDEVANLLRTPSMLLLLLVGGALTGYMMGRWVGALDSSPGSNRRDRA